MAEKWLTTFEAAKVSGYHPERIRELAREGRVVARKWGRDWQIDNASLMHYLQSIAGLGKKRGPKHRG